MKYFLSLSTLFLFLSGTYLHAQTNDTIVEKIREEYSYERLLKKEITVNPASMQGARKYSITTMALFTQNNDTPNEIQQKGKGKNLWGAEARTLQIIDPKTTVWGNASYTQGKNKQVLWNENSDYDIIYPFVAADSVGGDMKFENYAFSGGYSKKLNSFTIGVAGSYKASLSYRDVDPRPKNTTASFSLALGADKLMFGKFRIGAFADAEKYTQKHYLSFVSNQGFPMIYNMSGLGNYNELLSGKLRQAYYEGWSYEVGLQVFEAESRNWYFNVGFKKFNLDKLLTEYMDLNASRIDEQQFNFSLGKLFTTNKISWGLFIDGNHTMRKGTENLFLNDNSRNYIQIGSVEKYNHESTNMIFKGLLQRENGNVKSSLLPYFGLIQGKEKYANPLSVIELNKIVYGADYQWFKTFDPDLALSVSLGFSVTDVYRKNAVFNNSGKPSINQMLQDNYRYQSSDFWQAKLDINFHFSFPVIKNAYVGGKMMYSNFQNSSNVLFAATIGGIF
ncbi:hypothetical protein C1637_21505 [Chryseobacterium lactis]|uniref:DUF6850 domain-containing protein n=1 Tax=Chryseobacterium lactis TaxID=1241981 RepID=A0A3G6RQA9_CHRLC|nr:DUF6850 family outer membrane beta-barrel protein [Chryseobacterium lactis]AZA85195.1 hypothetical protein EG342_16355 [Chryseobacterium lactis]AZB07145.1 hypothetical protein EG341_07230 [Chryseobacterium lactis]PNW11736.1 hypothetical protein C1637_21505 [Chryseobacterium lactis]